MKCIKVSNFIFLFFIFHLYFARGVLKNAERENQPMSAALNQKKAEKWNLINNNPNNTAGCIHKKHDLPLNGCKIPENVQYVKKPGKKRIMYYIHKSPVYIADIITFRTIRHIHRMSMQTIGMFVGGAISLIYTQAVNILGIYLKSKYRKSIRNLLKTFLFRFITTYIMQLGFSFISFHYFNVLSQKIQTDYDMNISRSQIFSRIIGFLELNIVNHYLVVLSETVQILFIRLLFNRYETCFVKNIIYNNEDYLTSYINDNKYVVMYQLLKKFLIARINKMSFFNSNYLEYFIVTNLFFKYYGGSYNKYCPSEVTMPGVYADIKRSIPKDMNYATKKELEILREYCKVSGCHTCGRPCHDKFIGDHQPPVQVVKDNIAYFGNKTTLSRIVNFMGLYDTSQRLYAQCPKCSQIQSVAVRCKKKKLIPHAFTIRFFHCASIAHLFVKMIVYTKWGELLSWDDDNIY